MTESGQPALDYRTSVGIAILNSIGQVVRANRVFGSLVQAVEPLDGADADTLFAPPQHGVGAATIRATLADRKTRLFTTCAAGPLIVIVKFVPRLGEERPTRFLVRAEAAGSGPSPNVNPLRSKVQSLDGEDRTVVHDLNNLLGVIAASAESGRERAAHDPVLLQDLDAICAAAGHGVALLRKLVVTDGEEVSVPHGVDLDAAVQVLSPVLRRTLGARITLDVVAGAPPLAWLDPVGLDRAMLNLAVNARDAMPDGGSITLSTGWLDGHATLEVADTGDGIPPDLLPKVLRPGVTTKRAAGGQGLGLASVFEIVQRRGGLTIESASGEGTVVRLCFPVVHVSTAGRLMLLVEDEVPVRSFAARALTRDGWTVLLADSVASALAAAEPHLPNIALVVADLSLPDGDGLALIQRLRIRRPGLPAVLASGYPASVIEQGEHDLHLLPKPYGVDSLMRACAEAVGEKAAMS